MNQAYISDQVQRMFSVVKVLTGHEVSGLIPSDIAARTDISPSNVTKALANLEYAKWAEKIPGTKNRYRLATMPVQIANTVERNLRQQQQALQELQHNYTRLAV